MKVRSVDVGRVWDCMLCACVSEEGGNGEGVCSELLEAPGKKKFFSDSGDREGYDR
jgi:hypothetical protein